MFLKSVKGVMDIKKNLKKTIEFIGGRKNELA